MGRTTPGAVPATILQFVHIAIALYGKLCLAAQCKPWLLVRQTMYYYTVRVRSISRFIPPTLLVCSRHNPAVPFSRGSECTHRVPVSLRGRVPPPDERGGGLRLLSPRHKPSVCRPGRRFGTCARRQLSLVPSGLLRRRGERRVTSPDVPLVPEEYLQ